MWSLYGNPHIIPHNPNPGADDGFEGFRQAMNAVLHLAGEWPIGLKTVSREHVNIQWVEYLEESPRTDFTTMQTVWLQTPDVKEFAFYVGPVENLEVKEINVNAVIELPEKFKRHLHKQITIKDGCLCGSASDWCGEGCGQPQNNPSLQKGGSNG